MGQLKHKSPARASLLASGIIPTKEYCKVDQTQVVHKMFFRYGSHLNKYSAKDYVRTFIFLEYGVTDLAFFAPRTDDQQTFHVVFTTNWRD